MSRIPRNVECLFARTTRWRFSVTVCDTGDPDDDNDGFPDEEGNCPLHHNPDQADCDKDGMGDVCAIDSGASEDANGNGIPDECESDCPEDFNGDGTVGAFDLAIVLGNWGPNPGHPADLNGDGDVGAFDLALLLGAWGACP